MKKFHWLIVIQSIPTCQVSIRLCQVTVAITEAMVEVMVGEYKSVMYHIQASVTQ